MSNAIQGLADIQAKLTNLAGKGASRMLRSGVGAGMTSLAQSLRAAVNATTAPSEVKRAARKAIGKRYAKGGTSRTGKTTEAVAKVGFGVGFKRDLLREKAQLHAEASKKGVGLSAANVHWFVLGTEERVARKGRYSKSKMTLRAIRLKVKELLKAGGHPTGKIRPMLAGSVRMATQYGGPIALEAARQKITELLQKEAQTKG